MVINWQNPHYFFLDYYTKFGMDYIQTIQAYQLLGPGRHDKKEYVTKWSSLKRQYSEEYQRAKEEYLELLGIHGSSVFQKVWEIASTSTRDADRLKALELLLRYKDEIADSELVKTANQLQIEIVKPVCVEEGDNE